jgi:hypothetical protein
MKKLMSTALCLFALPLFALDNPKAIPADAKVYIHPMNGLGTYIAAGLANKGVPLVVVADLYKADFEITGESESHQAGWARTIFLKQTGSNEQASISVINRRTSAIAFAYAVNKGNSFRGKQSAAESCAKYLGAKIRNEGFAMNQPEFKAWGPLPEKPEPEPVRTVAVIAPDLPPRTAPEIKNVPTTSARFVSEPSGAEVRVNGQYQGTTPTADIAQREGKHRVSVSKSGFVTWESEIEMLTGDSRTIRAELKPAPTDPNKPKIIGLQ